MNIQVRKITIDDVEILKIFLQQAGTTTLQKFRYFNSRPIQIIKNHLATFILYNIDSQEPVGYGHLDKENEKFWLGIAISESFHGKGLGKMMMNQLILEAANCKVKFINITVDKDNTTALKMYKDFGFIYSNETHSYYELILDLAK